MRFEAIEARFDALLARGRDQELVGDLPALVEENPRRERLTAALMLALYRSGRQADALEAYQTLRTELGEGLGLEPSPELVDLEGRILLQDESLSVEAAPPAADFLRGYVLRGRIGEGAHGDVWRAGQPGVGREVQSPVGSVATRGESDGIRDQVPSSGRATRCRGCQPGKGPRRNAGQPRTEAG